MTSECPPNSLSQVPEVFWGVKEMIVQPESPLLPVIAMSIHRFELYFTPPDKSYISLQISIVNAKAYSSRRSDKPQSMAAAGNIFIAIVGIKTGLLRRA